MPNLHLPCRAILIASSLSCVASFPASVVAQEAVPSPQEQQSDAPQKADIRQSPNSAAAGQRRPGSVFSRDWFAAGAGFVYAPTYNGSNDYRMLPVPVIAASYKGIGIRPRAGGLAVNFFDKARGDVTFSAGPTFRFRGDRTGNIKDEVVKAAGKLETALEVGGQAGVSFNGVFSRYDKISVGLDLQFDVAGAHGGTIVDPGVSYSTPLGRGTVLAVSAGAQYADGDFADYYYSVTPGQSAASGLPEFEASSGWHKAGMTLAMGFDLSGDFRDGGLILGGALGYRRMLGDAKNTPFTSLRGNADQFTGIFGAAYVF